MISSRYLLAAALAAFSLVPGTVLAQSDDGPGAPAPIGQQQSPVTRQPLSRDALRNAKPMPMPELTEEEGQRLFRGNLPPRDTTPQVEAMARGDVRKVPLRWAGKLYHDLGGGSLSTCSAQFIDQNIIVTAAHCVVLDNGFSGPLEFYLQYDDGDYSAFYPIVDGRYYTSYLNPSSTDRWQWDYAILCTSKNSKTGHFGWRTLWAQRYNNATSIGYPSAIDKGQIIQVVSGPLKRYNPYVNVYELNQGVAKFTQGASGGAWVGDYSKKKGKNEVISVNSFIFANRKGRIYGPYLTNDFFDLLKTVQALPAC
jgi:V8-like Glu-specific endopeptidase